MPLKQPCARSFQAQLTPSGNFNLERVKLAPNSVLNAHPILNGACREVQPSKGRLTQKNTAETTQPMKLQRVAIFQSIC